MQRFVLCLLVLILTAAPVWAARNPIHPINKSPYVSALVIDADTGNVLFEDNADARVYPASVLKLMDLYVILDRIEQGALKLDEMVPVTERMQHLIVSGASVNDMKALAREEGCRFLRDDGLLKAWQGLTTVEEVLRVAGS